MDYELRIVPTSENVAVGDTTSFDIYLTNNNGTGITSLEMALFVNQPLTSDYPDGDDPNTFWLPMTSYVNGEPITDVDPMEPTVGVAIVTNNDPDLGNYISILMEDPNQDGGLLNGKIATITFNIPNDGVTPLQVYFDDSDVFLAIDGDEAMSNTDYTQASFSIPVEGGRPPVPVADTKYVNKTDLKSLTGIVKMYVDNGLNNKQGTLTAGSNITIDVNNEISASVPPSTLTGASNPTTATVGEVGQFYLNTTSGKCFQCVAETAQGTTPETYVYTWNALGGGTAENILYTTTAPIADNPLANTLIFVVLTTEPATKYNGYLYIIKES